MNYLKRQTVETEITAVGEANVFFHVRILLTYCHFQGVGRTHGVHRAHATLRYSIQLNIVIQLLFLLRRSFNENDLSVAIMQDNKDLL